MPISVCVSYSSGGAKLADNLCKQLIQAGVEVIPDRPSSEYAAEDWGADKTETISAAFEATYCILLLDRSYQADKWASYRRSHIINTVMQRRGFILPVQIGDDAIDVHALLNPLGKLKVAADDASTIFSTFMEKVQHIEDAGPGAFERPTDLEGLLRQYNCSVELSKIDVYANRAQKVGYEICCAVDRVTDQKTHFVLLYEGITLNTTVDVISHKHKAELRKGPLIVITPKDKTQTRLTRRPQHIESLFEKAGSPVTHTFYLDEFIWQNCTPKSFHQSEPSFPIRHFVEPFTDAPGGNGALQFIKQWYESHSTAILVIRGPGGVGKTTLAQVFSNVLSREPEKKTLFIDDRTISQYFVKFSDTGGAPFSIYDAYRAYMLEQTFDSDHSEILSFDRFMLNFDSGNILIIIDGLDQVIARLGTRFNPEDFLASIYPHNYAQKRKVIITCRSAFLGESYFCHQLATIEVSPFNELQATAFLEKKFPESPRTVRRGLQVASALTRDHSTQQFYPFILDIVATYMQRQNEDKTPESENNLEFSTDNDNDILCLDNDNDYVIYKICSREQKKYPKPHGLTLEDQLQSLMALAVKRHGIATKKGLKELIEHTLGRAVDDGEVNAFCAHTLLLVDKNAVSFKYDVIREHFKNIFLSQLFLGEIAITPEIVSLLAERNRFARESLRWSVERITSLQDDVTLRALAVIEGIEKADGETTALERGRAKSTVLLIVLQTKNLIGSVDRGKATNVLQDLFGSMGRIVGAALIDVTEPLAFNFCATTIERSIFTNYDRFWDCEFDKDTHFANCTLTLLPKTDTQGTAAQRQNFDMNTCTVDDTVVAALASKRLDTASARKQRYEDLNRFLRYFYKHGRFYPQRTAVLRGKYHGTWDIQMMIRQLKDKGLIVDYHNTEKKLGPELALSKQYEPDVVKFLQEDNIPEKLRLIIQELV